MAGIKISQLLPGGIVSSSDEVPISRGNETFKLNLRQFVTTAGNIGSGTGQVFSNKQETTTSSLLFRSLSGTEGINVETAGSTIVLSASSQNPVKTKFFGNGYTTVFNISGANSSNPNNYRVDIDGVLQEPNSDFFIDRPNSRIQFTLAPSLSSKVVVVSNNLVKTIDNGYNVYVSDTPPSSPSLGTLWYDSSVGDCSVYYYDGDSYQWVNLVSNNNASVIISNTKPTNIPEGTLWFDTENAICSVYYNDGDSYQWVDVGGSTASLNINTPVLPIANIRNYLNDTAAAAGGIQVGGLYRNGSVLQIRVS